MLFYDASKIGKKIQKPDIEYLEGFPILSANNHFYISDMNYYHKPFLV